ncbi:hypothetical protein BV22DRAFT_1031371 [Leucogyrophana mollusca]|uniref:Uncharacterized protein n=1 Tax=Leucogyrophana mollusca TaxID=85980 RepID=A0ACB8BQH3_9AGAM|nr:hypothetical protein BV22DRAFT_1031371 [Leucogyrophana mollusca]
MESRSQPALAPFSGLREHLSSPDLQLQLDIARVSTDIHQTQALLSRLKALHTLLLARCLIHEADSEAMNAVTSKKDVSRIRQSMVGAGLTIRPTIPNDQHILEALARLDARELVAQA